MKSKQQKSATWGRKLLIVGLFVLSTSLAFAGSHRKLAKEFDNVKATDQVNVIVQFNQVPTAKHHQKVTSRGGKINRDLGRFKGGAYRMSASALADLANDPSVVFISPDRPLKGASTSTTGGIDYHTDAVNAPAAWAQGLDGTGIGVAVIDSGIANVADLNNSNIVYSQDFTGQGNTTDQYGHGTHVSGIIAGNGSGSKGPNSTYTFQGIAGNANIINLRVLDQNGAGTDSEVIAAIQTAIQLKDTYNIRVINLSVGRPVFESFTQDPLCKAVEQAWQAGIVVVVAAGNYGRDNLVGTNGYGTITSPGNDPYVITVGAVNTLGTADHTDDIPASYSSKGPSIFDQVVKPDIVAPGNAIISLYSPGDTLDQETPGNELPYSVFTSNGSKASSGYFILSGTSMAAPMVSGAAALLLQQNPSLMPDQVKARLMKTAFKNLTPSSTATDSVTGQVFTEEADIFTVGAGELDIQAALANTDLAPATAGSALSPSATIDSNGDVVLVTASSLLPSDGYGVIIWGTSLGNSTLLPGAGGGDSGVIIWGTSAIWGEAVSGGDPILGGGTGSAPGSGLPVPVNPVIIWGTNFPAGDAVIIWGSAYTGGDNGTTNPVTGLPGTGSGLPVPVNPVIIWGTANSGGDGGTLNPVTGLPGTGTGLPVPVNPVIIWGTTGTINDK
jgi:serine protease AprX